MTRKKERNQSKEEKKTKKKPKGDTKVSGFQLCKITTKKNNGKQRKTN